MQFSIYRLQQFEAATPEGKAMQERLARTPCGRVVPLYCLVRVAGPFPDQDAACAAWGELRTTHTELTLAVKPDTGGLYSFVTREGP